MMKKSILLVFLGLVLALSGWCADDERERAWDVKMEQVIQRLLEKGASDDLVDQVLRDMARMREMKDRDAADEPWNEGRGFEGAVNTFYGYLAGSGITSGTCNSFFGRTAGKSTNSGTGNTFLGHKAGFYNTTGLGNTFVGYWSGY